MKPIFQVSLLSLFLLPLNAGLWADTIYLQNGESLQGTFLGLENGYYKFQTQDGKVHCILREETIDIRGTYKPKINLQKIETEDSIVCGESEPLPKEGLTPEGKPLPKEGLSPSRRQAPPKRRANSRRQAPPKRRANSRRQAPPKRRGSSQRET